MVATALWWNSGSDQFFIHKKHVGNYLYRHDYLYSRKIFTLSLVVIRKPNQVSSLGFAFR